MASELRRRDVLRASGALALAGAAGCLDDVTEEVSGGESGGGTDPDGNDSAPADDNETGTPEGTDDPGNEGTANGTDGNDPGGSNGSDGSDATKTPEGEDDSNETDTSVEDGEGESDGEDRENGSEEGDDGADETNDEEEPDGTESESGEGSEGSAEGEDGDDGAGEEGTETEDGAGDSAEGDGTGGDEDGKNENGNADGETLPNDPPEGFVAYANDELGYAIAHPEGWEVEESVEEVYVGDPGSRRELGVLTLEAAEFGSSDALAAAFLKNLKADYENVEVREEGDRTLASGQDARLLDVVYGDPEGDHGRRRSRMLFAIDPDTDTGYVAEVAAPVEAFDDAFAERAETMLESFRIGEGG